VAERLPLSALLSQALVAFTIEFDNEFEHRTPHRTTDYGSTGGSAAAPWLVSMVIWIKYLRFVPDAGISVRELGRIAALSNQEMKMWLSRLSKWWGYLVIDTPGGKVQPTLGGLKALQVWRPLTGIIEERWRERFGADKIDRLRKAMQSLVDQFDPELPDFLPILGYDMLSAGLSDGARPATHVAGQYTLPILLAKALLAFANRYEAESGLSLAISANVLRLAGANGTPTRDLPRLSGVSKEAVAMAVNRLEERGFATVRTESKGSRVRMLRLTSLGQHARDSYFRVVWGIEKDWTAKFGSPVCDLRLALERLAGENASHSLLFKGLEPYSDGWRASVPKRHALPHYPMILHRGGFPDGS